MDWAEELKFSIRKKTAKMGRRAAAAAASALSTNSTAKSSQQVPSPSSSPPKDDSLEMNLDLSSGSEMPHDIPPRRKLGGGWADNTSKSSISSINNFIEDERFKFISKNLEISSDFVDEIPIIPDLDEMHDTLLNEIAEPPNLPANRPITLDDLGSELLTQKAFSSFENVDLSILTKCLEPQEYLDEPDDLWDWDKLFTEVTADIYEEKKKTSASTNKKQI